VIVDQIARAGVDVGGILVGYGDHLCVLYRGRAERDALLMAYLDGSLRRGDACLCVTGPGASRALERLAAATQGLKLRTFRMPGPRDRYLKAGVFRPDRMIGMLDDWSRTTFAQNWPGFATVAADMSWAAPLISPGVWTNLEGFESQVTRWARGHRQLGMCMYDLDVFGGEVVVQTVKSHPRVWVSGTVLDNPCHDHALNPEHR
jgi:hypothetical protein